MFKKNKILPLYHIRNTEKSMINKHTFHNGESVIEYNLDRRVSNFHKGMFQARQIIKAKRLLNRKRLLLDKS